MTPLKLAQDITPVSDFRAHAADHLEKVRSTQRPLVLTQRGHSTAVVLDVREYDRMVEELELLRDIRAAEDEAAEGRTSSHEEARTAILRRLEE